MPTKDRLARLISRLGSKRPSGSSLVVQTGFPTSLADLVVKNRAKFKKRKKQSASNPSSDLDSTAIRSHSDGSNDPHASAAETPNGTDVEIEPLTRRGDVGGSELGFLLVKLAALVALAALAVGGKWVVAGITILAVGVCIVDMSRRSPERNVAAGFDFGGRGVVSPIREVEEDDLSSTSLERIDFDLRGSQVVSPIREIEVSPQNERICEALIPPGGKTSVKFEVVENQNLGISQKVKRKKLFTKLFCRKNRERKDDKEESSSFIHGSRVTNEEGDNGNEVKDDDSDEEYLSPEDDDNEVVEIELEEDTNDNNNFNVIQNSGSGIRFGRWKTLVFLVVVLLGLLGGKVFALMASVVLYLLSECTGTVSRKWKMR